MHRLPEFGEGEHGWKRRLLVAVRAANLGIWDWNLKTDTFVYSDRARQIFGFGPDEEVTRERLRDLLHPEDRVHVAAQADRARNPDMLDSEPYRYRIYTADTGELRWVEAFGELEFEEISGKRVATRYIGTLQDITAQVQSRNTLMKEEARLRMAIEASGIAVWELDVASGTVVHSPELNRLCGFPTDAHPTLEQFRSRYAPGEAERLDRLGAEARARGETSIETEVHHIWPDGTERWLSMRAQLAPGETQYDGRVIGVLVDITDHKQKEKTQKLLLRELSHRIKNSIAVTQSIINQTLRGSNLDDGLRRKLAQRLQAMADTHDEIAKGDWQCTSLHAVLQRICSAFGDDWSSRIQVTGEDARLDPRAALSFSLLVHELLTNAVKYGALSRDTGRIRIATETVGEDCERLRLIWSESGGPTPETPDRSGFGSRLMDGVVGDMGGVIRREFPRNGLHCEVEVPRQGIEA